MTNILDPEDYDAPSETRPGEEVKEGFQDKSGTLPRPDYWNSPDVNVRARGRVSDKATSGSTHTARRSLNEAQLTRTSINEPNPSSESTYPNNKVTETISGHVFEVDDTPGHERLYVKHKSGSNIEILPDGSVKIISARNKYNLTAGSEDVVIRGVCNIVVESDANLRVQGDTTLQSDGDLNTLVLGDYNLEVKGDLNERIHGNTTRQTTGYLLEETRGNVEKRSLSNYKARITGTSTFNVGGDITITSQAKASLITDDTLTIESEGGFIDLKTGYLVATTLYATENIHAATDIFSDNMHASNAMYTTEVHTTDGFATTWNGNLEGTAKKSTFADTAGLAAIGSPVPTTPVPGSATSPTDATDAPTSDLVAIEVDADVIETQDLIKALDKSTVNGGFQTERLDTYRVTSRARNAVLRRNSEWLQDAINDGIILNSITSSGGAPNSPLREAASPSQVGVGIENVAPTSEKRTFQPIGRTTLRVTEPPTQYEISGDIRPSTQVSPNFFVSHFLGGDSDTSNIKESNAGIAPTDLAKNMQLVAYNILEPLRRKYGDIFNISEGLYNLLPNETLDGSSINVDLASGLGVGIQISNKPNSFYYDVASWLLNNIVFDKIVLSYIDYDPAGKNEPTLLVTIKPGFNSRSLCTEWNHQVISQTLQDLS